jgi:hypothetical protein
MKERFTPQWDDPQPNYRWAGARSSQIFSSIRRIPTMRNWLAHFFLAFAFCSWVFPAASLADDETLSIVKLAFRDHTVTISSSPEGLRYSVCDSSDALLSENLTEQELLAAHPKLHSQIRSGHAGDASGTFIWAGRDEALIEQPQDSSIENE